MGSPSSELCFHEPGQPGPVLRGVLPRLSYIRFTNHFLKSDFFLFILFPVISRVLQKLYIMKFRV